MGHFVEDHDLQEMEEFANNPLIDGVLWERDRAMCFAPEKTGKSILALQIARCLAGGQNFLRYEVPQVRTVLYLAGEGDLDELQSRSKEMGSLLKTEKNRLFFWPMPEYPLNKEKGIEELLEAGRELQPALTIFDPTYALMSGSMVDDEAFGDFVRNLNRFQGETGSALFVTHHTHRPRTTDTGQRINEGDNAFFGSFLFKAWPKRVYLLERRGNNNSRERKLSSTTYRDTTGIPEEGLSLTLVEPSPLILQEQVEGWSSAMWQVWYLLEKPRYKKDIVSLAGKPPATIYEAVAKMEGEGVIVDRGGMYERNVG